MRVRQQRVQDEEKQRQSQGGRRARVRVSQKGRHIRDTHSLAHARRWMGEVLRVSDEVLVSGVVVLLFLYFRRYMDTLVSVFALIRY